jgi:peptidoglycan hydrolase-like protein with peptidoglycan-binding domain
VTSEYLTNLTRSEMLFWAATQIGTSEDPPGSNRVPYWLNTKPEWNGSAWCAAFLQSGALVRGEDMRDDFGWGPYYVPQIRHDAVADGAFHSTPEVGDWVIMGNTTDSHIGIVEKVVQQGTAGSTALIVQTIEGNTSPTNVGSQNNGDGVYRKLRTGKYVRGFFRPNYAPEPLGSSVPPIFTKPTSGTRWSRKDVETMQGLLETKRDGRWGANTQLRAQAFRAVAASSVAHNTSQIRVVQAILDVTVDGSRGPATRRALTRYVEAFQAILKVTPDGNWGPGTDRAYLAFHKEWRGR